MRNGFRAQGVAEPDFLKLGAVVVFLLASVGHLFKGP